MQLTNIPKDEQEGVLSSFWTMLRELEQVAMERNDAVLKKWVQDWYTQWSRITKQKIEPMWVSNPKLVMPTPEQQAEAQQKFIDELCKYPQKDLSLGRLQTLTTRGCWPYPLGSASITGGPSPEVEEVPKLSLIDMELMDCEDKDKIAYLRKKFPRRKDTGAVTGWIPMDYFEDNEGMIRAGMKADVRSDGYKYRVIYRGPRRTFMATHTRREDAHSAVLYLK